MNETVNNFLQAGDKSMNEMYLRKLRFTYRACGPFTKNKKGIQKFKRNRKLKTYLSKRAKQSLVSI